MEYYIKGNPDKADLIKEVFKAKGWSVNNCIGTDSNIIYFTVKGYKSVQRCTITSITAILLEDLKGPYKELPLPKFEVADAVYDTSTPLAVAEYVEKVDVVDEIYVMRLAGGTKCQVSFDYAHRFYGPYSSKVNLPFEAGDLVLGRDKDSGIWRVDIFSHTMGKGSYFYCAGHIYRQCIPFKGNESLAGTSQMCCKGYPSWCYGKA